MGSELLSSRGATRRSCNDGVSEYRTLLGVVTLKMHDRAWREGSLYDLQGWILRERFQGREFRGARTT